MAQAYTKHLAFDQNGIALLAGIVDAAMADARILRTLLPDDEMEARQFLSKRVIEALQRGETDMVKLREALLP